jgi:hypothetical protein
MTDQSISYIIATYSHRKDYPKSLQIQLEQLRIIFQNNKIALKNTCIKNIIVVCPELYENRDHSYYQYDKWKLIFDSFQIPIYFIDFPGKNEHFSYDQWLFGYLYDKTSDYYILIEDDYCIDISNLQFDKELIKIYKCKFPEDIGYLCTVVFTSPILHAAVSNGMVSKATFEKINSNVLNKTILDQFYNLSVSPLEKGNQHYYMPYTSMIHPQITFSRLFTHNGIAIKDVQSNYICPYWNSGTNMIQKFLDAKANPTQHIIIPIQMV